jgi:hypothetical protein
MGRRWGNSEFERAQRPPFTLKHPTVSHEAFDWSPVNLLEEFDDVENAVLDEVERLQAKRRRSPMLDEVDDD